MSLSRRYVFLVLVVLLAAVPAFGSHAWGSYHWARKSNPFTLKVHDNLTSNWEPYLAEAQSDWNQSSVLDLNVIWNSPLSNTKRCTSATGVIEVCNDRYGNNGWLGVAGIWASGDHITKAYTKLNDSYFNTATYNTPAWRRLVTCQEIGHDFGLGHQDETFDNANLGSCMDYTNDPDGGAGGASNNDPSNEHPNSHDYSQISSIYSHLDGTTTIAGALDTVAQSMSRIRTIEELVFDAGQWGTPIRYDGHGRPNLFALPLGVNAQGQLEIHFTRVFWAPDAPQADRRHPDDE